MARSRNGRGVVIIGIGVVGVLAVGVLFLLRPWETPDEAAAVAPPPATAAVAKAATPPARQPMNIPNAGAVMRPFEVRKAKSPTTVPNNSKGWMDAALGGPGDKGSTPVLTIPQFRPPPEK